MSRKTVLARLGLMLAVLFAFSVDVWGEVFALPRSDKLLTFEITVPGLGEKKEVERNGKRMEVLVPTRIQVTTREGTLFQIQDKARTYWFGFVANLDKSGAVTVSQFGIVSPAPKVQNATGPFLQQKIELGRAAGFLDSMGTRKTLNVNIKYVGVRNGSFPDAPPFQGTWDNSDREQMEAIQLIYGDPSAAICCVGCGPLRVCGDAVDIPGCGSCGAHGGGAQI